MQSTVAALEHRVPREREDELPSSDGVEVQATRAHERVGPVSTAVAYCEHAPSAAVRLLARPVVLGNQAVLLIEEGDRDRLVTGIAVAVGDVTRGEQTQHSGKADGSRRPQWM